MTKQFHEGTISKLLKDLRYTTQSRNPGSIRRTLRSIEVVVNHEIGEQRIVIALTKLASSDSDAQVRDAAADALTSLKQLGFDTSVSNTDGALEEAWYEQFVAFEQLKNLWGFLTEYSWPIAGFASWFIINGLYFYDNLGVHGMRLSDGDAFGLVIFTVPANLLVLIVSALIKPTRGLAFGFLLAMAVNLVIATILGVGHNALYFVPFFQD